MAAFAQSWRNAFQSKLSQDVNVVGVTLARFLWAGPLAAIYLSLLYYFKPVSVPTFSAQLLFFVIAAACLQILATVLMVKLFKLNNFAVGAGLAKSEALVAAILGSLFFGTSLSWLGWLGVLVGTLAILLMSTRQGGRSLSLPTLLLGIACGTCFALTSLWVREASLTLDLPTAHRAAWVLLFVIGLQTCMLVTYLLVRDRQTLVLLHQKAKLTFMTSATSCIGSIGWFSAMALQSVPYVKTLGQVEIFFTMLVSLLWLKQPIKIKDGLGLALIAIAAVMVIWL